MNFFHKLKLPGQPLKPGSIEELYQIKQSNSDNSQDKIQYNTIHFNVEHFFTNDVLKPLEQLNLRPIFFVHFGSLNNVITTSILHSDVAKIGNKWVDDCAAINWILSPGQSDFVWYDTSLLEKVYPPDNLNNPLFDIHNGINYGARRSKDISKCVELARLPMEENTPYLVRADVAHQISYVSKVPIRLAVSLRFPIEDIQSWDNAVNKFGPILDI